MLAFGRRAHRRPDRVAGLVRRRRNPITREGRRPCVMVATEAASVIYEHLGPFVLYARLERAVELQADLLQHPPGAATCASHVKEASSTGWMRDGSPTRAVSSTRSLIFLNCPAAPSRPSTPPSRRISGGPSPHSVVPSCAAGVAPRADCWPPARVRYEARAAARPRRRRDHAIAKAEAMRGKRGAAGQRAHAAYARAGPGEAWPR
jgi:hypothetical protein